MPMNKAELCTQLHASLAITKDTLETRVATPTERRNLLYVYQNVNSYRGRMHTLLEELDIRNPSEQDVQAMEHSVIEYQTMLHGHQALQIETTSESSLTNKVVSSVLTNAHAKNMISRITKESILSNPLALEDPFGREGDEHKKFRAKKYECVLSKSEARQAIALDCLCGQVACRDALYEGTKINIVGGLYDELQRYAKDEKDSHMFETAKDLLTFIPLPSPDLSDALVMVDEEELNAKAYFVGLLLLQCRKTAST
jgi:hypothetical protein